jgi:hypothetical protein
VIVVYCGLIIRIISRCGELSDGCVEIRNSEEEEGTRR